jgi:hypothetical protein
MTYRTQEGNDKVIWDGKMFGEKPGIRLTVRSDEVDKGEGPASLCFTIGGKPLQADRAW